MSQVQGALGDASADTEGLRQLALQLGSDTVFSATEAAQAMVELAKGGLTEADTAKIVDVVNQAAGYTADQIKIIEVE